MQAFTERGSRSVAFAKGKEVTAIFMVIANADGRGRTLATSTDSLSQRKQGCESTLIGV